MSYGLTRPFKLAAFFVAVPFVATSVAAAQVAPMAVVAQSAQSTPTTTSVTLSPPSAYAGTTVVAKISVTDTVMSYPSGTVACVAAGTTQTLPPTTLINGVATWTLSPLGIGSYGITCNYSGATGFSPSTSQSVTESVVAVPIPAWQQDGNMETQRSGATATLLGDGTVLIAGGINNTPTEGYGNRTSIPYTTLATADIYTEGGGITATHNTMSIARAGHTATLLNDGRVLITGGDLDKYLTQQLQSFPSTNGADLYTPGSGGGFTPTGAMKYARCGSTATKLLDGTVLIVGGSSVTAPAEVYNPATGTFKTVGTTVTARFAHTATLLSNGMVLIAGGMDNIGCVYTPSASLAQGTVSSAELYNPATGTFAATGSMNVVRAFHTATILPSGKVLIAGGTSNLNDGLNSAELYDPVAGTFSYTGSLNTARGQHTAAVLNNGQILLAGGSNPMDLDNNSTIKKPLSSAELYNPATGIFTPTISLNTARSSPTAVALGDGTTLEIGGTTGTGTAPILASLETYVPTTVTAYVNPKYVIVGVTYAAPGPSSNVTYTASTSLGTTSTLSSSFAQDTGYSVSIGERFSVGIGGNANLSTTLTNSGDYTEMSSNSTAVTISKTSVLGLKTTGTPNAFYPVNHDYDTIWLWLNPLTIFTVDPSQPTALVWNGYAFDQSDPASGSTGMDIYPVLVGYLNGDFGPNPSEAAVLARSWAANQTWPAGEGPGLTPSDLKTILAVDPFSSCGNPLYGTQNNFSNCAYTNANFGPYGGPLPATSSDQRFTTSPINQDIPYLIAGLGNGGGVTSTYSLSTTNSQSVTTGLTNTVKQAFGIENSFSIGVNIPLNFFTSAITVDTKFTNSLTWVNSYQTALNTSQTLTNALSVTGPGCAATSPPCNPQYFGPGEFVIYQDNLYGSFMFYPAN